MGGVKMIICIFAKRNLAVASETVFTPPHRHELPQGTKPNDYEALYKARNSSTKSIDQSLIVVGEQLNLPFVLTMHVARHTFAVNALNDGLSMTMVSQLLGHGNTDITERVYAKFLPETLADEVAKLNYDFLPKLD